MTFSVGGLATGLDTKSIIDQLIAVDSQPKTRMQWSQSLWTARQQSWQDVNTRLSSFQTFANNLTNPASWNVFSGITSTDNTKVNATSAGTTPQAGTFAVNVTQLAATETWDAANALPSATAGTRSTGTWYKAGGTSLSSGDLLTDITDQTNTSAGLNNGSTISMAWNEGNRSFSSTFNVTASSTFGDLQAWAQTQIPGATVAISGGQLDITSATGTASEVTSLGFSARDNAGSVLNRFNGSLGAQSSQTAAASDGGVATPDTLQFVQGSSTSYVNIAAGDNAAAIASKINATSNVGVTASVVSGKLHVVSNTSGTPGDVAISSSGALAASLGLTNTVNAQDSQFTVNGTAYTRTKNTGINDVLTNVNIDLLNTTATPVSLTVGAAAASNDDIKSKVKDLVNQYNSIMDFVNSKTSEAKVPNPANLGDYLQGAMSRDYQFSSVAEQLRSKITDIVQGQPVGFQTLADIGISTGTDRSGKLTIDDTKLDSALATNRTAVRDLFMKPGVGLGLTPDDGVARKMSELVSQMRVGGTVDSAIQGAGTQIAAQQKNIDNLTARLVTKKAYYDRMFAALEANVSKMQSQGSWLTSQIAQLK